MKKLSFIIASVMLLALVGCTSNNASSDLPSYAPFEICDEGGFRVDGNATFPSLRDVIVLLEEKNVPIIEMKGSSRLNISDGGSVQIDSASPYYPDWTDWSFNFAEVEFSQYDVVALEKVFGIQDLASVYIETPYEIFTFRSSGNGLPYPDIDEFHLSTIRISHPQFTTEKGVKIGDSPKKVGAAYGEFVFDNRSYKQPDEDWSISGDLGVGYIEFVGNDSGVKYIEVGGRYA